MDRVALVTGGTDGIGRAVAERLARAGLRVLVVGRDGEKGRRVERELQGAGGVRFLRADLSLVEETRRLAEHVAQIAPELHILVHGAGVVRGRFELTREGVESNFAVNFLARFELTRRLLPALGSGGRLGAASRILLLSGAATSGTVDFADANLTRRFGMLRCVRQSCLVNDLFTVEMARRLSTHTTINCLKIGVVKTSIRREFPLWMKLLVPLLDPVLAQEPAALAEQALSLLLGAEHETTSGRHFMMIRRFRPIEPPNRSDDPRAGRAIWALGERMAERALAAHHAAPISAVLPVGGSNVVY